MRRAERRVVEQLLAALTQQVAENELTSRTIARLVGIIESGAPIPAEELTALQEMRGHVPAWLRTVDAYRDIVTAARVELGLAGRS
jgi:hypothetical protein